MNERRIAYVIGFGAPPVLHLHDFLQILHAHGWDSYVILSPTAATWVDATVLSKASGHPVRVQQRTPRQLKPLPPADAVFAAPLTFNSLNKWAAGISDTLALGLLNEAVGLDVPVTAALCINQTLRRHPAFAESLGRLSSLNISVLDRINKGAANDPGSAILDWPQVLASQNMPDTWSKPKQQT